MATVTAKPTVAALTRVGKSATVGDDRTIEAKLPTQDAVLRVAVEAGRQMIDGVI